MIQNAFETLDGAPRDAAGVTFESAFEKLGSKAQHLSLTLTVDIQGNDIFDLELALNEVLRLVNEGYTSGFDRNDNGQYRFSIQKDN